MTKPIALSLTLVPLFKLAFRLLIRTRKANPITTLFLALAIATATVTSISLFTSRIDRSLYDEASHFIAADLRLSHNQAITLPPLSSPPTELIQANWIAFSAMVFSDDDMLLAQVKAVDNHYPLRGQLTIQGPQGEQTVAHGPQQGHVWLAPRLASYLKVKPGGHVDIGNQTLKVSKILIKEPDSSTSFFESSPRAMIHYDDVDAIGAIQLGSRVNYALLLAGDADTINRVTTALEASNNDKSNPVKIDTVDSGNRQFSDALSRAQSFIFLAGSLAVLLGAVAIALAALRFSQGQVTTVAYLKTIGLTPSNIRTVYLLLLSYLLLLVVPLGLLLGWLAHMAILFAIQSLFNSALAAPSISAFAIGAITPLTALLAFAAPPILRLARVTPLAALQSSQGEVHRHALDYIIGLCAIISLTYIYSNSWKITLFMLVGLTIASLAVWATALVTTLIVVRFSSSLSSANRIGVKNIQRHQFSNATQIMIFCLLFCMLAVIVSLRTRIIQQWQDEVPDNAPNYFAFNIYQADIQSFESALAAEQIEHSAFFPMTRGRINTVNDIDRITLVRTYSKNNMDYEREVNLTYASVLPVGNELVRGVWWPETNQRKEPQTDNTGYRVSLEENYAQGLNIDVGDAIVFTIAGQIINATVGNIRTVDWNTMTPNFFVIFDSPLPESLGANWVTSFNLNKTEKSTLSALSRQHPNITFIELDQVFDQIRAVISKVSSAVELIFLLITGSAILVLIASIQSTLQERLKESATLRTLGATKVMVRRVLAIEFGFIGLAAGTIAVLITEIVLYLLQSFVFKLPYSPSFILWLILPLLSFGLITALGLSATRHVINQPPMTIFRQL